MEKIKLLVLDVDGTLTNGKLYIDNYLDNLANEGKAFHVRDGFAMVNWLKQGGEIAILTGKYSNIVSKRAEELGIKYVIQASKNKTKDLKNLLSELNLNFSNVAYMGDDVNDIGVMLRVACP
ncbi:KdsC family phosphatase, partial [Fusobacterium gastrosuis]|uniref:KdsC family phosphatase n=1 Tax=Fusobacterium gastrosuis TaxID=1755100 RepID=UPI002A97D873|nr:HAD-IIIA family hydrolase [Fusobacterium gastrosuis]